MGSDELVIATLKSLIDVIKIHRKLFALQYKDALACRLAWKKNQVKLEHDLEVIFI